MARVKNEFEQICWVPGTIQTIDSLSTPKVYDVFFFNGQNGQNKREDLLKIDKKQYGYSVNFIRNRLGDK